jgi:hypothetical protein
VITATRGRAKADTLEPINVIVSLAQNRTNGCWRQIGERNRRRGIAAIVLYPDGP